MSGMEDHRPAKRFEYIGKEVLSGTTYRGRVDECNVPSNLFLMGIIEVPSSYPRIISLTPAEEGLRRLTFLSQRLTGSISDIRIKGLRLILHPGDIILVPILFSVCLCLLTPDAPDSNYTRCSDNALDVGPIQRAMISTAMRKERRGILTRSSGHS